MVGVGDVKLAAVRLHHSLHVNTLRSEKQQKQAHLDFSFVAILIRVQLFNNPPQTKYPPSGEMCWNMCEKSQRSGDGPHIFILVWKTKKVSIEVQAEFMEMKTKGLQRNRRNCCYTKHFVAISTYFYMI